MSASGGPRPGSPRCWRWPWPRWSAAAPAVPCASCAGTAAGTRARTRAAARRRSRARSASRSAGRTPTAGAPSGAAVAPRRRRGGGAVGPARVRPAGRRRGVRGLLVAGTASDAGKSVVTAGICRWLARQGLKVAPFKAQNMSLNSVVTRDGCEIGVAQAMQAAAAGIEPEGAMNPVLLKPGAGGASQVMLLGEPVAEAGALSYQAVKPVLRRAVLDCLAGLRERFDVVVCEGAGSPAEINLRDADLANMGLARAARLPVIVVGDIDRGGVFAALFGSLALLSAADQALVGGFIVNKFRGDARLLQPGLDMLRRLTGRPVLGVLPSVPGLWIGAEDSLSLGAWHGDPARPFAPGDVLRVAVVRLPRISNFTDADPLAAEPSVVVRYVTAPGEVGDADLVIVPGSRATVADLAWLRERGLADAIVARARAGRPVLGICAGFQMLADQIHDE